MPFVCAARSRINDLVGRWSALQNISKQAKVSKPTKVACMVQILHVHPLSPTGWLGSHYVCLQNSQKENRRPQSKVLRAAAVLVVTCPNCRPKSHPGSPDPCDAQLSRCYFWFYKPIYTHAYIHVHAHVCTHAHMHTCPHRLAKSAQQRTLPRLPRLPKIRLTTWIDEL